MWKEIEAWNIHILHFLKPCRKSNEPPKPFVAAFLAVPALQRAWISNGDYFIFLLFSLNMVFHFIFPNWPVISLVRFPVHSKHLWMEMMPLRVTNQQESGRDLKKTDMSEWSDADTDMLGRVKPFCSVLWADEHRINTSVPQEFELSCTNVLLLLIKSINH